MTGLALILGIPHEPPVAAVVRELQRQGYPHLVVDQRQLASGAASTWWADGAAGGELLINGTTVPLDDITGVYTRLTAWTELPGVNADPEAVKRCLTLHHAIEGWLETTPARVINRTSANDSNNSKPYQALLIREYFDIPTTLVTNDPAQARRFWGEFGQVIFKSISGERSIVTGLTPAYAARLPLLVNGPIQLQELITGTDIRVHVIGDEVLATRVESQVVDYRYDPTGARMTPTIVPADVSQRCIALIRRLGLELAGIDLRVTAEGRLVCFEVNPSPAYIAYEQVTGQPIAAALARHLAAT